MRKEPRVCAGVGCEVEFVPLHGKQRFCSSPCHALWRSGRQKELRRLAGFDAVVCEGEGCEVVFTPRTRNHRFCSGRCRDGGRGGRVDFQRRELEATRALSAQVHRQVREDRLEDMATADRYRALSRMSETERLAEKRRQRWASSTTNR